MTNEQIKHNLKKLYDCKSDFSVTQTGKKSGRVNGLYKPLTHEIILHNLNFKTDNALMFTAIHEFTHHILDAEKVIKSARAHNNTFWNTFYSLIDKAVSLGLYSRERSMDVAEKTAEIGAVQKQIIELQKKQGKLLNELHKACNENGDRFEDVLEHDLQISRAKSRQLQQMSAIDSTVSDEMTKVIVSAKDELMRNAAKQAAADGATVEQVKAIVKDKAKSTKPANDGLDSPSSLIREKKRLEATIERCQDRITNIDEQLLSMGADGD